MNHFYLGEHIRDRSEEFPPGTVVNVMYLSEVFLKVLPDNDVTRPYFLPADRAWEIK